QMQRVRRRAHERGGAELLHPGEPGWRILPAAWQHHRAEGARAVEACPKSDEEAEREREEDPIGRRDAGPREHESPAPCPPLPRCRRVEGRIEHQPARRLRCWILPWAVLGRSLTNSIQRGYL